MALPGNKNFSDYDNYVTDTNPTTSAQAQDYFRNQAELLKAVIDCDFWQPETVYQPGDVVKSDSMPNGTEAVMVATKASVTSNVEPQWGEVGGAIISDGACFWKLRRKAVTVNGIKADNEGNVQIPVMQGSNSNISGADGLVPAPPKSTDELFLNNEGEWKEAGKVKSVNGKTGDVVVGEIKDLSINGTTVTVTFADGTTKTLTTQAGNTVSITAGTVANGGTIPLPSGYTRNQCKYAVWAHDMPDANGSYGRGSWHRTQVNQSTGVVYVKYCYENNSNYQQSGTAGYLCIAVK